MTPRLLPLALFLLAGAVVNVAVAWGCVIRASPSRVVSLSGLHRHEIVGGQVTFQKAYTSRCGQVRDSQRNFLFPGDAEEIGSVALVPLGKNAEVGFLAIGSADADRFHPGMSIDLLTRVGELVSVALKRY